ncbi:uncharacterized protein LOC128966111 [Oppia nitens]|uniref:uncharacterized protein LOC128966111 n=1 Tax=Oppia nitens TaxID=1686743 RepID=UPI0023D97C91|nr:uncharacterized protein LOC128966111 [Oppia nitens]
MRPKGKTRFNRKQVKVKDRDIDLYKEVLKKQLKNKRSDIILKRNKEKSDQMNRQNDVNNDVSDEIIDANIVCLMMCLKSFIDCLNHYLNCLTDETTRRRLNEHLAEITDIYDNLSNQMQSYVNSSGDDNYDNNNDSVVDLAVNNRRNSDSNIVKAEKLTSDSDDNKNPIIFSTSVDNPTKLTQRFVRRFGSLFRLSRLVTPFNKLMRRQSPSEATVTADNSLVISSSDVSFNGNKAKEEEEPIASTSKQMSNTGHNVISNNILVIERQINIYFLSIWSEVFQILSYKSQRIDQQFRPTIERLRTSLRSINFDQQLSGIRLTHLATYEMAFTDATIEQLVGHHMDEDNQQLLGDNELPVDQEIQDIVEDEEEEVETVATDSGKPFSTNSSDSNEEDLLDG